MISTNEVLIIVKDEKRLTIVVLEQKFRASPKGRSQLSAAVLTTCIGLSGPEPKKKKKGAARVVTVEQLAGCSW